MKERMITTYSMWNLFRNCRKACEYRYIRELVPLETDHKLAFGKVIHSCLELWHGRRDLSTVRKFIDETYPAKHVDEKQQADWHLAMAMMESYAERYHDDSFEIVALEKRFEDAIINPATGAPSLSFRLAGRVDGIVKQNGAYFLLEHKTASQIDSGYLEKLWTDLQISIYAYYLERTMHITVSGIIYNILGKAKLRQGKGETEDEFEKRRQELIVKSVSGKSSAKRKLPESDEAFRERLMEKYRDPEMFHREMLYLSRDQFDDLRKELWELTKAFLDAQRRGTFYHNTSYCFQYGRACAYYPICRSAENPVIIENHYTKATPHQELLDEPADEPEPVF